MTGIAFEETIPVAEGEYQFIVLLQNSVAKEFSIVEKNIIVADDNEKPQIFGPILGYKIEDLQAEIHVPFRILGEKLL